MTTVYFLQTHKNPAQITRLVRRIKAETPDAIVLIYHHEAQFRFGLEAFDDLEDVHISYVQEAQRATFSLVSPFLDALDWLFERGIAFDWIVMLSGQCYPARSLVLFEQMLAQSSFDAYMQYFEPLTASEQNIWGVREGRHRYLYHYRVLRGRDLPTLLRKGLSIPRRMLNGIQSFAQLDTSYGLRWGLRARRNIFQSGFRCYGGSAFKTLSHQSAAYLARFSREQPEITDYFRPTLIPDEAYMQTVLANNQALRICNNNLHYIDWRGGRLGHPRTLSGADYAAIVASGAFFARKFDTDQDEQILDRFDQRAAAERAELALERSYGQ